MFKEKTIARNREALLNEIFSNVQEAQTYRLDSQFKGTKITADYLRNMFFVAFRDLKLRQKGTNQFYIRVHSNYWVEFSTTKEFV